MRTVGFQPRRVPSRCCNPADLGSKLLAMTFFEQGDIALFEPFVEKPAQNFNGRTLPSRRTA